jgi:hypothetical protein
MRHLVYSVRYPVLPINSSLLTITLYYSVITTLVYNDTKYSVPFMTLQPSSTVVGPKREEVTGEWIKLYKEELHDFCPLPNVIRVNKTRRMR